MCIVKGLIVVDDFAVASSALAPGRLAALLPVANRPLLMLALDTLRGSGVRDVAVVARQARHAELRMVLDDADAAGAGVTLIAADQTHPLRAAVAAARRFLQGHRFIVHRADGIWLGSLEPLRRALSSKQHAATFLLQPLRVRSLGVAGRSAAAMSERAGEYEVTGVHIYAADCLPLLDGVDPDDADALDRDDVAVTVVHGQWVACAGGTEEVVAANRAALDELQNDEDLSACTDCGIEGRVRVDPTARVSRSLLRGPVIVGPGALVDNACLGPYTAVGTGAIVENSDVIASVLCEGSVVRDVNGRVENSVIGPRAIVSGDFRLPRSLRLSLGADATISLT